MADNSNLIRSLLVQAEDARLMRDMWVCTMATTGSLSPGLPLFFSLWLFLLKQRDVAGFRHLTVLPWWQSGFPGGSDSKESACKVGDPDSIPGAGRSPGEGKGYPLQYSCLDNSWISSCQRKLAGCSSWGRKELDMTEWQKKKKKLEGSNQQPLNSFFLYLYFI